MDEVREGLQYLFQTESKYTCLLPGPGHAGMEASIANLVEPGETIVVANKGIWGARVVDLSERYGAKVVDLQKTGEGERGAFKVEICNQCRPPGLDNHSQLTDTTRTNE